MLIPNFQLSIGAATNGNKNECENPRCITEAVRSSTKNLLTISRSGIVPAIAPSTIALLPIFFPSVASATEAPKTICVNESIKKEAFKNF